MLPARLLWGIGAIIAGIDEYTRLSNPTIAPLGRKFSRFSKPGLLSSFNSYQAHALTFSLENTGRFLTRRLPLLIRIRQLVIHSLDAVDLCHPLLPLGLALNPRYHVRHRARFEKLIFTIIQRPRRERLRCIARRRYLIYRLEDVDVVWDPEEIPAVLVSEEVVELGEARPGDPTEAEGARLVRREEYAVFGLGAAFLGGREEGLDAVNFTVEEWGGAFVV